MDQGLPGKGLTTAGHLVQQQSGDHDATQASTKRFLA